MEVKRTEDIRLKLKEKKKTDSSFFRTDKPARKAIRRTLPGTHFFNPIILITIVIANKIKYMISYGLMRPPPNLSEESIKQ